MKRLLDTLTPASLLRAIDEAWPRMFPEEGDEVWLGSTADLLKTLDLPTDALTERYIDAYLALVAIQAPERVRQEEEGWAIYQCVPAHWFSDEGALAEV